MVVVSAATSFADEIRKWRDAEGNLHYSVTGSPGAESDATDVPLLHGRDASPEEAFSVDSSLRRREIEQKLTALGRALEETRAEIRRTEDKTFDVWVSAVTRDPRSAQASLDAQRGAFLAASQFNEEKADSLRRLRRRERDQLKEIRDLWKKFGALDREVTQHYGKAPDWWRSRLDCRGCPTIAQVEEALSNPRPTPSPGAVEKAEKSGSADEDDEEWGDSGN